MPRITHAQYQELEQKQEQAVADRTKIAEQHIADIQTIEAQVKVVASEHDAVVEGFKTQIKALEEERNELRSLLHTESETSLELRQDLDDEKSANKSLHADLVELRCRGEASINILTSFFLVVFGVSIAAIGQQSNCQEPEL